MKIGLLIAALVLLFLSRLFLSIWVYKDAKSRGINPFIWIILVLFVSGSFMFLLYFLIVRNEKIIKCENCNFTQSDKLLYCGRCGSEIKIYENDDTLSNKTNNKFLNMGIIFLVIGIILGAVVTFEAVWKERGSIPISFMSVSNKYGNRWKSKFNYKNGKESHTFRIKDKTILNASWDLNDGDIEAELYIDDTLMKLIYSKDYPKYDELIDLSEYQDSKVLLKLKFIKAKGKIEFKLE